ncbi:DUF6362 family protein [Alphaproteobacteria bacterium]|nr:DUF6362 family protein [Alphaproteobacteria bacterium]
MAVTERRLPRSIRKQKLASWPAYPMDWHGYGWTQIGEVRLRPTGEQIDDMDRAHRLVMGLDEDDRRLVLAVAHSAVGRDRGPRWSKLAHILGLNDPRIVKRHYKDVLIRLYYKL